MSSPCADLPSPAGTSPPPPLPAQVWRASSLGGSTSPCVSSGFAALDAELPGGGWPTRALTEILLPRPGVLEWRLLAPGLRSRALVSAGKPLLLLNPPHVPHLPGLLACGLAPQDLVWIEATTAPQQLWAAEQAIKSNAAGAIVAWLPQARPEQIRRLQTHALAAEAPIFLLRPLAQAQQQSSAAPLRLAVETASEGWDLSLRILKRRGPVFDGRLHLAALPGDLARALSPRMLQARPAAPSFVPPAVEPRRHALARAASHQPTAHG